MAEYRSRPRTVQAMRWWADATFRVLHQAEQIVAWVNANGGEARYEPWTEDEQGAMRSDHRIAVRTADGWAYAAPGHYVVMGDAWIPRPEEYGMCDTLPQEWLDVTEADTGTVRHFCSWDCVMKFAATKPNSNIQQAQETT